MGGQTEVANVRHCRNHMPGVKQYPLCGSSHEWDVHDHITSFSRHVPLRDGPLRSEEEEMMDTLAAV